MHFRDIYLCLDYILNKIFQTNAKISFLSFFFFFFSFYKCSHPTIIRPPFPWCQSLFFFFFFFFPILTCVHYQCRIHHFLCLRAPYTVLTICNDVHVLIKVNHKHYISHDTLFPSHSSISKNTQITNRR